MVFLPNPQTLDPYGFRPLGQAQIIAGILPNGPRITHRIASISDAMAKLFIPAMFDWVGIFLRIRSS